jgi:hypothetical protein
MEEIIAKFKVPFQYFSGETEETHKEPYLGQPLFNQDLNLRSSAYEASVDL